MTIQLSAIKALSDGGPVTAWIEYLNIEGLELLVEFASQDELAEFYGTQDGGEARTPADEEFRRWHLARVKDWRGVLDGDAPAPFDRSVLELIWDKDSEFQLWLVRRCRHLGTFLKGQDPAASVEMGASGSGAAA